MIFFWIHLVELAGETLRKMLRAQICLCVDGEIINEVDGDSL